MTEFSFWELRRISIIQWSFILWEDLEVEGSIALTGPNGSGKSSLVDAVQTVLTGAHGNMLRLNSRAAQDRDSAAGRRTVRDYVLGAADDLGGGLSFQRDQAVSYIMLGFRHTDGREATAGICISASKDSPDASYEARFVVEGRMLQCKDVADVGCEHGRRFSHAHRWAAVAARLRLDKTISHLEVSSGAELFVKHMLRVIGPRDLINPTKFLKNIKSSIAFRGVNNVNDFIRSHILDEYNLDLASLRQSIFRHRALQAEITALNTRISRAEGIRAKASSALIRERTVAGHELWLRHARLHLKAVALATARSAMSDDEERLESLTAALPTLEKTRDAAVSKQQAIKEDLERNSTMIEITKLEASIQAQRTRIAENRSDIETAEKAASSAVGIGPIVAFYDKGLAAKLDAIAAERLSGEALVRRLRSSAAWDGIGRVVESASKRAFKAATEAEEARKALDLVREELEAARSGVRLMSADTRGVIGLLKQASIGARPLCELVKEVKADWHATVEAILGGACEALIVDPADYQAALRVVRGQRQFMHASLVNTTKTGQTKAPRKGSLATVIKTLDPHARAFIDFRLGAVAMVETEAELAEEESAATKDLMFSSARTCRRLQQPRILRLGKFSAEETCDRLDIEMRDAKNALNVRERASSDAKAAEISLRKAADLISEIDMDNFDRAVGATALATDAIASMAQDISRLQDAPDTVRLKRELVRATKAAVAANDAHLQGNREQASLSAEVKAGRSALATNEADVTAARAAALAVADDVVAKGGSLPQEFVEAVTAAVAAAPFIDLRKLGIEFEEIHREEAEGKALEPKPSLDRLMSEIIPYLVRYNQKRLNTDKAATTREVFEYSRINGVEPPTPDPANGEDGSFRAAAAWIEAEIIALESNELARRERDAADASAAVSENFKNDFVGKMASAFDNIQARLRDLNRHLGQRQFHGLVYKFEKKPSNACKDMIALVDEARERDLFVFSDSAAMGGLSERAQEGHRRLVKIAEDPEESLDEISNPKLYFEFDIALIQNGEQIATVTKRAAYGSAGQVQVPGYVTLSTAVAASAYPGRAGTDGGITLAMFDEVFDKTDTEHTAKVIQFMKDIGLQAFLVAPDEKRTALFQLCDTIISIHRSGASVTFDTQKVSDHTRHQFKLQNPAIIGLGEFRDRIAPPALMIAAE